MDWRLLITHALLIGICCLHQGDATCVLETDFGFTVNCGFKKSGLFRVRNLGGVKGYVGLGFSLGDELGFPQSLSTTDTDSSKRRSVNGVRSVSGVGVKSAAIKSNSVLDVAAPATAANGVQTLTSVNGVKRSKSTARSISGKPRSSAGRLVALAAPIPPFKPILPAPARFPGNAAPQYHRLHIAPVNTSQRAYSGALQTVQAPTLVPPFQALPASITKLSSVPGGGGKLPMQQMFRNSLQAATNHFQVRQDTVSPAYDHGLVDNTLALRTLSTADLSSAASTTYQLKAEDSLMGHSIQALAKASNLSVEAITAAIAVRQQQLLKQQQQTPPSTTTTTPAPVTLPPVSKKYPLSSISKVMNAPKEYYPVGYDKNFDDNFASRVELPDTSFYCGDQKHFPGLYADEDLGCMVFHVCAFTDDGLIMKSFLCPESTLFDQTILKCNWWFYVDCKTSVKLYDSNIPISKSYQLMKALAFFSTYKKS